MMNISAKTEYACIAMLVLATTYDSGEPAQIRRIADAHGIPSRFLVQILLQLKAAGLVNSTRGAAGGYRLARDPDQITLWEVMSVIERPVVNSANATKVSTISQALHRTWERAAEQQRQILESTTLSDLIESASLPEQMYYI